MSVRGTPARSQDLQVKGFSLIAAVRSAKSAKDEIAKPSRLQTHQQQPKNGDTVFDPEGFLVRSGLGKKVLSLKKDQVAYSQGDPADTIYYVQRGRMRVTVTSANGKEATLALVSSGEFLGENCMISPHPTRLATATAMTDSTLLRISKAEMVRALDQEPAFSNLFVSFLLVRNARIQADLVDQLFNSSEKRLARILLLLAQFGKESKPETVVPKVSQETLAEMIGTTRSRVSFFMNRFRKLGFIEYNGEIRVHNSLLNIFLQE